MADEDGLYLDNLEEFINDEDRVVTYKWLSRTLSVSSNQAKQMLYAYLVKQKADKNTNNISATYLVGGRCNVDDQMVQQFTLTNYDNLDNTKSCFDVVTSVHVYSLQKSKPKDSNALYMVDYNIQHEHKDESKRYNHIYCKEAKPFDDGGANRGQSRGKPGKENSEPGKSSIVNGQGSSSSNNFDKPKTTNQKSKKGQLPSMGMFAVKEVKKPPIEKEKEAQAKASEPSKEIPTDSEKKPKSSKTSKQAATSMLSFFGKQVSGQEKTSELKEEQPKDKSPEKSQETENNKEKPEESKNTAEKLESRKASKEAKKALEKKKENKKTPENKPKESKKTNKSRRRIKNLDSSDEEEEEEEDPIPQKFTKLASDSESNSEEDVKPKKAQAKKKKDKQEEEEVKTKKKSVNKKEKVTKDTKKAGNEEKPKKENRKRKKEMSPSSSEEESPTRSKSNCTVVSETPVAEQHSTGNPTKKRKRRKVMRSKTYVDDDGFMVTEKVYESESTDASDEEPILVKPEPAQSSNQVKKTSPEPKTKKVTELKPAKQASLMSFFKKT